MREGRSLLTPTPLRRKDATLNFWKTKDSVVARDDQVTVDEHLHSTAEGAAINGSYDWFRHDAPREGAETMKIGYSPFLIACISSFNAGIPPVRVHKRKLHENFSPPAVVCLAK
jgi:hypothetical protein